MSADRLKLVDAIASYNQQAAEMLAEWQGYPDNPVHLLKLGGVLTSALEYGATVELHIDISALDECITNDDVVVHGETAGGEIILGISPFRISDHDRQFGLKLLLITTDEVALGVENEKGIIGHFPACLIDSIKILENE